MILSASTFQNVKLYVTYFYNVLEKGHSKMAEMLKNLGKQCFSCEARFTEICLYSYKLTMNTAFINQSNFVSCDLFSKKTL